MKRNTIKEWYTCKLPNGEIQTLTLEECKQQTDSYLNGIFEGFYDNKYILVTDYVTIYKHTCDGKFKAVCRREPHSNDERNETKPDIDYGILGYFTAWEDMK